jgi:hypothetical protein
LLLIETVQEIALVLGPVLGLEQLPGALELAHAGVMTGSDTLCTDLQCVLEKSAELDLRVAQHIRIRRAASLVLAEEMRKNAFPVLAGEVHHFDVDAEGVGNAHHIDQILAR